MRLHRLSLTAVGPYADEQVVDFDRLSASGLYLLEGPTGAGKSTILDAVTFALYGELSTETSARDRLHSDFAEPGRTPTVTLEWSVRGRRLRITRIPEHERPSRRKGHGPVKQAASVHLEQLADGQWMSVSSNKAETGELVTDLMGLNRAQFTQVVLLPQGEFARFLRADDDTRRVLLTKLFGTQLFDRVTAALEQGRYDAQRARAETQHHVEQALAAAAQAAGLAAADRQALVSIDPGELTEALEDVQAQVQQALVQAQVAAELTRDRSQAAGAAYEQARGHAERVRRVIQGQQQLREHESTRPAHLARAEALALIRRADPIRPLLTALEQAEQELREAQGRLRELVGEPTEAMSRGEGARRARDSATAAATELAALAHLAEQEQALPARWAALTSAEQDTALAARSLAAVRAELAGLPALMAQAQARQRAAREAAAPLQAAQARLPNARARLTAGQEAAELDPRIADAHELWLRALTRHGDLVREHATETTRRLTGMSAELAAALRPGIPCSVCGSVEHPMPATGTSEAVTAEQLDAVVQRRDQAELQCKDAESRLRELTRRRDTLAGLIAGSDLVELSAEVDQLDQVVATATDAAAHVTSTDGELAAFQSRSDQLQAEHAALAADHARLTERVVAERAALDRDEGTIAAARAGHPSVRARCAALQHSAEQQGRLAELLAAVATAHEMHRGAGTRAQAEALARGFTDLAAARSGTADHAQRAALQEQVDSWERTLTGLQGVLGAPDLAGVEVTQAGAALDRLEQAGAELAQATAEHEQATTAAAAATRTEQAWSQCMSDVRRAKAAHARTYERTAAVVRLAALAKGTEGQRRVSLTTYVLRHWFHQVVQVANQRLAAMSAGRYELERVDEHESKARRAGLTLTVIDRHTGERRHPSSLSGGETFFTSLALALGLADVVKAEAGGVDLDTLFIDEGFGTLDASTLDQVMTVIDDLRDRGRVVGIVSHVAELKDRVPERLEIRRTPDGSSSVRVVA